MELEKLVNLARQEKEGVLGACMTGGGFGGCTVTLLRTHALASTMQRIEVYHPSPHMLYLFSHTLTHPSLLLSRRAISRGMKKDPLST